jgi:hypothetical protein
MKDEDRKEIIEAMRTTMASFNEELLLMESKEYTSVHEIHNAVLHLARKKNKEVNDFITEKGYHKEFLNMFSRYIKNERLKEATDELSKFILKWL